MTQTLTTEQIEQVIDSLKLIDSLLCRAEVPPVPEAARVGEMPFLGSSEPGYVRGWNDCRAAMLVAAPEVDKNA